MNSCRCWSENRHESSWNWWHMICIDWFTRYVDTGKEFMILYESHLIQIDFKIYLKVKSYLNPYSFVFFPLNWENAFLTKKPSESIKKSFFLKVQKIYSKSKKPSESEFFHMDSEHAFLTKRPSESIWIWIFQMDSENVFLTKRLSESIWLWIFRWIQKMYSLLKGHLNPSESEFFRWIQKMYSLLKGCLNQSESEFFRWIEKMYIYIYIY